jgi:hypothetical protein
LPRLETINFTFYSVYNNRIGYDDKGRLALQAYVLGALVDGFSVRAPPKLTSLSFHNLRTWHLSCLESPPFQTVLTTLRHLHLSVLFDSAPDPFRFSSRWCHFWDTLPRIILAPTQDALTELTLHSDEPVGAWSGFSLTGLHFPHLYAVSLRNFIFMSSVGIVPFVLQHASTLTRLEILSCTLPLNDEISLSPSDSDSPSTAPTPAEESSFGPDSWHPIWDRFAAELTTLIMLRVDGPEFLHTSSTLWEIGANEQHDAADVAALRRFRMIVAARSLGELSEEA